MNRYFNKDMIFFKSAFKGYDKKDVNNYIEQMNTRFTERENALKSEIARLEAIIKNHGDGILKSDNNKDEKNQLSEYQATTETLGKIILKAELDADKLISKAKAKANQHILEAEQSADKIKLDANVSARLMTEKTKNYLSFTTDEIASKLNQLSTEAITEYKNLFDKLKKDFDLLNSLSKNINL